DDVLDTLAFAPGATFYTRSGPSGNGAFGFIQLVPAPNAITTSLIDPLPAAHGMTYDPFSGKLVLQGDTHVTMIDPSNPPVVYADFDASALGGGLAFPCSPGFQFDQG